MFPDRNNSELTGLLAQTWKTLKEEEKALYAEEAKALNLQHEKQFPKKKKRTTEVDKCKFSFKLKKQAAPTKTIQKEKNTPILNAPKLSSSNVSVNTNFPDTKDRIFNLAYFKGVYAEYLNSHRFR